MRVLKGYLPVNSQLGPYPRVNPDVMKVIISLFSVVVGILLLTTIAA